MDFKAQALTLLENYLTEWESNPNRTENSYQYESTYAEMMEKVAQEILQLSVGQVPKGVNSKKNFKPDLER